jgi:uncharacterized membrane protein YfcA
VQVALVFIWSGFVRAGLGFGGAVLSLPLLLMIDNQPLFWLPILSLHLIFFTSISLKSRVSNIDWPVLKNTIGYILPLKIAGVFGLVTLPNHWLVIIIYGITSLYAIMWTLDLRFKTERPWADKLLLAGGGYLSGTSLSGAPLIAAVYVKLIARNALRDTMWVLWLFLVSFKAITLYWFGIDLQIASTLALIPAVGIGHFIGLHLHERLIENDRMFKRVLGVAMIVVSVLGISRMFFT